MILSLPSIQALKGMNATYKCISHITPKPVTEHEDVGVVHYHRRLWSLGDTKHASYYVVKIGKETKLHDSWSRHHHI